MANFGGGKAFAGAMEGGIMMGAFAIHGALQQAAVVRRQIDHDARVQNSVNRLASAFMNERRKSANLVQQLEVERAKRKFAEFKLAQK